MRLVYLEEDIYKNIHLQEKQMAPGFKVAKDQVMMMMMLDGNTNGEYKLKPFVIFHAENSEQ
jgi:hypothetical protein